MALLDYLFPMQTSDTITGLLGEDEARKIRQQSQTAGLLNLGANLLALSGPSSQQRSFGQMLAPSLLAGYQAAQGTTESQLQQRLAAQKMERENAFRKAISESMVTRPTGTGLTQTGPESQAALLARPEFGGGFANEETLGALMSNPNLPTTRTLDQNKFMSALAEYSPLEFAKLQMQKKSGETFRPITTEERRKFAAQGVSLPADQAFQVSDTGKILPIGSGPLVKNVVGAAENVRQKGYGEIGVEENKRIFTSGQAAVRNIGKIDETLKLLEQGDATTGLGAELVNNINRTQLLFTDSKKKIKEVSDTELLNSLLGADVFPQIGALGIGARGLDTPAEREFLRQVMTGTINMNKETLLRLTRLRKKYEERSINEYNRAVEEGQLDELFEFARLPKRKLTPSRTLTVDY